MQLDPYLQSRFDPDSATGSGRESKFQQSLRIPVHHLLFIALAHRKVLQEFSRTVHRVVG
jgi:hypothetical protein